MRSPRHLGKKNSPMVRYFEIMALLCVMVAPAESVERGFRVFPWRSPRRRLAETTLSLPWFWKPGADKILVALCLSGRLSDQWRCLRRTLQAASLLNRSMVVPPRGVAFWEQQPLPPWDWATVIDWPRTRSCLNHAGCGLKAVFLLPEYLQRAHAKTLEVSRILCLAPGSDPVSSGCYNPMRAKAVVDASDGMLQLPLHSPATVLGSPLTSAAGAPVSTADVRAKFGHLPDAVLCVGDLAGLGPFQEGAGNAAGGMPLLKPLPTPGSCRNLWRPNPAVVSFVDGITDTLLGTQYAAVHLKVTGTADASAPVALDGSNSGVRPVAELADLVRQKLKDAPTSVLYLATDARKGELEKLEALLKDPKLGKHFAAVLTLRMVLTDDEWLLQQFWSRDAMLIERKNHNGVAFALIDKYLCARAKYFVGSKGSAFTEDILYIRRSENINNPVEVSDLL